MTNHKMWHQAVSSLPSSLLDRAVAVAGDRLPGHTKQLSRRAPPCLDGDRAEESPKVWSFGMNLLELPDSPLWFFQLVDNDAMTLMVSVITLFGSRILVALALFFWISFTDPSCNFTFGDAVLLATRRILFKDARSKILLL